MTKMTSAQERKIKQTGCDVRFDNLTRQLYSTDASIYQVYPVGAAFPKTSEQASLVISAAADASLSVTPRGAGTSLVGNAIGEGLVVDFSRYNGQITGLDLEKLSVHVGAGVVLDQLNDFLKPHGFCFGPDVATSSRATLGGMIANNSSGARCPIYGTTADHVISLEIVMAEGRVEKIGPTYESLSGKRAEIEKLVCAASAEMAERWPPGLIKRWPGYGIERFLRAPNDLTNILAGSEGTLAAIFSAELKISPLPHQKGLVLIFFASVAEAMQATVELLDLKPAAIEHIDRPLLDQTKGQLHFQAARDLLELDTKPCESMLIVEFYDDATRNDALGSRRNMTAGKPSFLGSSVAEKLSILQSRKIGLRTKIVTDPAQMNLVWSVRKSGLSLLTGCVGPAKPVAFIEDAAVRPAQLPEYVRGLQAIMKPLALEASYYGHAASGLLHVRPVLNLHSPADLKKFRQVADQTSALVRQFKGSLSAEHGVGVARTEYMREQLGDHLLGVMREIKHTFDPKNIFNPGKIFACSHGAVSPCPDHDERHDTARGLHTIDNHLRENFTRSLELPFQPVLAFAFKDRSFVGNLEQCNGCGGCLKQSGIMCPTFIATHDEVMSTRGRANIIRAALELRLNGHDPLESAELDAALSNCLSCKGCTPECPSNVNLALIKAEMLHARWCRDGLPLRERILSNVDLLGKLGCLMPTLANRLLDSKAVRIAMEKTIGISAGRSLPHYATERFDHWFAKHCMASVPDANNKEGRSPDRPGGYKPPLLGKRSHVILWDDTFVRYHEPHIGIAAVKVLEALGFEVSLLKNRKCCGRPAFSQGNLDAAAKLANHNVKILSSLQNSLGRRSLAEGGSTPILFLEPSCWSMFVEDYRELKIENAENIATRCFLFEKFVDDLLERDPQALALQNSTALSRQVSRQRDEYEDPCVNVAIHPHCHAKSILNPAFMARLAERLPGRKATVLDTACCGMAGAFGALAEKYDLSVQVADRLLHQIDNQPPGTEIIASGTSCRHQITDLTNARPKHMAELIADAIA
ncbi:MAG TPA: FAD-linked oxidase C-terminal domain-containing protein [Candidatus Udaeobacter sp.]|jgi:FAD/FMN-containing dehydrogenase/Fe-S oxidoreductase